MRDHQTSEEIQMNVFKAVLFGAVVSVSSLAMAEGGGDRNFARMQAASDNAQQVNQLAQQKSHSAEVATQTDADHAHSHC
ncbi:co-regulatory protein PtrA N-terminal domain-containing protein [Pseudomonas sp. MS19]|uniref:co-regulatory protein PtrA N-terminal domain-containing protein n=1 Tax=Pseudomonas sp. MS19 TaxID=2579939 RepID=UPI0031F5F068